MELKKNDIIGIFGPSPYIEPDIIYDIVPGQSAKGRVHLLPEYDFFSGHFPGKPVLPGVLIIDMLSKVSAAIFAADGTSGLDFSPPGYFSSGEEVKFRRVVNPGDILELEAKTVSEAGNSRKVECRGTVQGEEAVSCILEIRLVG